MMKWLLLLTLLFIPIPAFADEGEGAVKALGWLSIGVGVLGNIPFVIYNRVRKISVTHLGSELARSLALMYKPVLNMHVILNIIGYIAGMTHGLLLVRYLDPISLSLAIVMSVLMASGLMLRYTSSRNVKIFNRLLHGQALLALLLIVLIGLHVATAED